MKKKSPAKPAKNRSGSSCQAIDTGLGIICKSKEKRGTKHRLQPIEDYFTIFARLNELDLMEEDLKPLFLQKLALDEMVYGKEDPRLVETLSTCAFLEFINQNYAHAEDYLLRALGILRSSNSSSEERLDTIGLLIQSVYLPQANMDKCDELAELFLAEGGHEVVLSNFFSQALLVAVEVSNTTLACEYGRRALDYVYRVRDSMPEGFSSLCFVIAGYEIDADEYESAAFHLEQGISMRKEAVSNIDESVTEALFRQSRVLILLGNFDKSLECAKEAYEIYRDLCGEKSGEVAVCTLNLAEVFSVMADHIEAEKYFLAAVQLHEELGGKYSESLIEPLQKYKDHLNNVGRSEEVTYLDRRIQKIKEKHGL